MNKEQKILIYGLFFMTLLAIGVMSVDKLWAVGVIWFAAVVGLTYTYASVFKTTEIE